MRGIQNAGSADAHLRLQAASSKDGGVSEQEDAKELQRQHRTPPSEVEKELLETAWHL